jgi:hypothetical protein
VTEASPSVHDIFRQGHQTLARKESGTSRLPRAQARLSTRYPPNAQANVMWVRNRYFTATWSAAFVRDKRALVLRLGLSESGGSPEKLDGASTESERWAGNRTRRAIYRSLR